MGKKKQPALSEPPHLTDVHARFFTADIEFLKQEAVTAGELGWHPRLRHVVHEYVLNRQQKKGRFIK